MEMRLDRRKSRTSNRRWNNSILKSVPTITDALYRKEIKVGGDVLPRLRRLVLMFTFDVIEGVVPSPLNSQTALNTAYVRLRKICLRIYKRTRTLYANSSQHIVFMMIWFS